MKTEVDDQEQYGRRECLELRGIPVSDSLHENTDDLVQSVGKVLDIDIQDSDISVSHRLPISKSNTSRTSPAAIIVKFTNRKIRDNLYRSRLKLKDFDIGDIGFGRYGNDKIYIQESLTAKRRKLFNQCLAARKKYHYKFIWTYYGTVYLRKNESCSAVKISSSKDLELLEERESTRHDGSTSYS